MLMRLGDTAVIEARWGGATHRLELDTDLRYSSPSLEARLDAGSLTLLEASPGEPATGGEVLTLEPCATMFSLLHGLSKSMPHLPWASPPSAQVQATRIDHPGYED